MRYVATIDGTEVASGACSLADDVTPESADDVTPESADEPLADDVTPELADEPGPCLVLQLSSLIKLSSNPFRRIPVAALTAHVLRHPVSQARARISRA